MALSRFFVVVLFLVLMASVANAYTIVMRNGRRVEIPNEFTVTNSMLTYTAGSGIQITIQLSGIDIAATEWANGEPRGSFFARVSAPGNVVAPPSEPRQRAQRSITNQDLEAYKRTRIQSEIAYEKRRKELGLPSAEEWRLESAAIAERTREQLLGIRSEEEASEDYWRSRANSLRTEVAANQAQIDFVRQRLDELPPTNSLGAFSTVLPFGNVGTPIWNSRFPNILTPTNSGITVGINTGQRNMGHRRFPFPNQRRFGRFHGRGRFTPFGGSLLALPFDSVDHSLERTELVNQLNELEMHGAGLKARWRAFEEEARRAGAYPGWLR